MDRPERIWLNDPGNTVWMQALRVMSTRVSDDDTEYIRADIANAEIERLKRNAWACMKDIAAMDAREAKRLMEEVANAVNTCDRCEDDVAQYCDTCLDNAVRQAVAERDTEQQEKITELRDEIVRLQQDRPLMCSRCGCGLAPCECEKRAEGDDE